MKNDYELLQKMKDMVNKEREETRYNKMSYRLDNAIKAFDEESIVTCFNEGVNVEHYEKTFGSLYENLFSTVVENLIWYCRKYSRTPVDYFYDVVLNTDFNDLDNDYQEFYKSMIENMMTLIKLFKLHGASMNRVDIESLDYSSFFSALMNKKTIYKSNSALDLALIYVPYFKTDEVVNFILKTEDLDMNCKKGLINLINQSGNLSVEVLKSVLARGATIDNEIVNILDHEITWNMLVECLVNSDPQTKKEKLGLLMEYAPDDILSDFKTRYSEEINNILYEPESGTRNL